MFMRGRRIFFRPHEALKPVTIDIPRGQTIGIVGANGSGKSTLLQIVAGTLTPTSGKVEVNGRLSALLELGAGFNPEFSGNDNIALNARILGLGEEEIAAKYDSIVAFSGLNADHLRQPVKTYSSGMYVRLAFSVAIAVEPDILVVDEALAVGDEGFQRKCFARIKEMQEQGTTILFVSHSSGTIVELCDRAMLFDHGELLLDDVPKRVVEEYHKLLFAPPEYTERVRTEIRSLRDELAHSETPASHDDTAPASRVVYPTHGAEILSPQLLNSKGDVAHSFWEEETATFTYQVRLDGIYTNLRCGMLLKTTRGIDLGGAAYHIPPEQLSTLKTGDMLSVTFTIPITLEKGTYFLNCGCFTEGTEGTVTLHRIVDAVMFKVLPSDTKRAKRPTEPKGMIDFSIIGSATPSL